MDYQRFLEKAMEICLHYHKGQKDKGGQPYILHPIRIMLKCKDDEERILALIHDVLEDTDCPFSTFTNNSFPSKISTALIAITKTDTETYKEYIERVAKNDLAKRVKILDIKDNLDPERLKNIPASLINRYRDALNYLGVH